jgi:hypothetical protein
MSKRILKKVAQDWASNILLGCGTDMLGEQVEAGKLDYDEVEYILDEVFKIARRISDKGRAVLLMRF